MQNNFANKRIVRQRKSLTDHRQTNGLGGAFEFHGSDHLHQRYVVVVHVRP